ncbi:flagellar export protein FliJ [Sporolactobacillus spathodeae]|uniref:Flagellar FliJ protein n=1 Tax=Sporolactobacillus spathodeae TaxID=1465502 RepID=A0ABS2Q588_9BACL|nr:flagellar export protein FliJ [Sporolactobacillus spathodeae]MBM7656948.1 flagellar FliJ protein [Sporolactobacillus spathodeae]
MAFEFRLERVMKIVKSDKERLETDYQSLFEALEGIAHQLMDLMEQKKAVQQELQNHMTQAIMIDSMKIYLGDIDQYEKRIHLKTLEYTKLKSRLEKLKPILREKAINLKKYEKMRDRAQKDYDANMKKKEMKQMDEIASLRVVNNG